MHSCIGRLRCRYYAVKKRKNAENAAAPFLFTTVCGIILHEVYLSQARQIHRGVQEHTLSRQSCDSCY